ncbi:serine/threonine-protein kinase 32B [Elysia marginata]|uniref:Serine/threonine-protein kinase 32B n=1 Tax=Elysia marginata TaxID=1093978 RepID=A0AAV4F6X1_9GAST|nr:serine/threonine-protein kinase 32B [Elysia marginata]
MASCGPYQTIKRKHVTIPLSAGHVHITDFNIAAETRENGIASSLSGTKPYMAPEIFNTALGEADGYSYPVDWWALGVTIFELLKKRRPFVIHGDTGAQETLHVLMNTNVHFPSSASDNMNDLLRQLLLVDPKQRTQSAAEVKSHPAMAAVDFDSVQAKKIKPLFVPSVSTCSLTCGRITINYCSVDERYGMNNCNNA